MMVYSEIVGAWRRYLNFNGN